MSILRTTFGLIIVFVLAIVVVVSRVTPTLAQVAPEKRVLYIGVDGLRGDAIAAANTPALDALIADGAFHDNVIAGNNIQDSSSAPGWSTLLTGVWATKHNVFANGTFEGNDYANYPHFFTRLKAHDPTIETGSIVHWVPINFWITPDDTDITEGYLSDGFVTSRAAALLEGASAPDVLFVHLDDVDGAGHTCCFDPANSSYQTAIEVADGQIGALVDRVTNRPNAAQEDWLIIIASDHGGINIQHGGQTPEEQRGFLIMNNSGPEPYCSGTLTGPMTQVDVLPHIYDFLDVPVAASWALDGSVHPFCDEDPTSVGLTAIGDDVQGRSLVPLLILFMGVGAVALLFRQKSQHKV